MGNQINEVVLIEIGKLPKDSIKRKPRALLI